MPYYGDAYHGDPGIFGFIKRTVLGRVVGGIVKAAVPGASGVLTAVNAIRGTPTARTLAPMATPAQVPGGVPVQSLGPRVDMAQPIPVTRARLRLARVNRATINRRTGRAESPFARRMRLAREAAARRRR